MNFHYRKMLRRKIRYLIHQIEGLPKKTGRSRMEELSLLLVQSKGILKRREVFRLLSGSAVCLALLSGKEAKAQASFATPVASPFSLSSAAGFVAFPAMADLDNDGDLDMLIGEYGYNVSGFRYYENTGTAANAVFGSAQVTPFGLTAGTVPINFPTFGDIDNDGDYDLLAGGNYGVLRFYLNTGTANAPAFGTPSVNPYGLSAPASAYLLSPQWVDLDNDGDLDIMATDSYGQFYYYENTGTANAPAYSAAITSPYGLTDQDGLSALSFSDLDGDGDLDLIKGYNDSYAPYATAGSIKYYQNIGSANVPNFAAGMINPFGLSGIQNWNFPAFADMDNDGDLDIMAYDYNYYGSTPHYFENIYQLGGPLVIQNITINTPSCVPGNDATVLVSAIQGTGTISYIIGADSNQTGSFANLSSGNYMLRVRDSLTIIDTSITIGNTIPSTIDSVNSFFGDVTCNGFADGMAFLTINNANNPITYLWQPINQITNQPNYFGLSGNTYTVYLTDAKNCQDSLTFTINEPPPLVLTVDSTVDATCLQANGAIYTSASGGTGSFSFNINPAGGTQPTPGDFTGLVPNIYTIDVTDANGCTQVVSQQVNNTGNAVTVTISSVMDASTSSSADGSIVATSNGVAPVTYSIAPNTGTQSPPGTFSNLPTGTYTITAVDANGCTGTQTALVGFANAVKDVADIKGLEMYPNPVGDELYIEADDKIQSVSLVDLTGKIVLYSPLFSHSLPVRGIPAGVYFVKIEFADGTIVHKAIQKR